MLKTLSGWLKKAQAQRPEAEAQALLSARLAPDMFPLSTQVRFACVQAQEAVCRLRGEAFPTVINELLDEGRQAGGKKGTDLFSAEHSALGAAASRHVSLFMR